MFTVTHKQFADALPGATDANLLKFLPFLNKHCNTFGVNTPERMAVFLAQISQESGSLRYTCELTSGSAYEYRKDLGNLEGEALRIAHAHGNTTGKFYKGHGLIQITGYYNHVAAGKALGIDCVNNPILLTTPEYAMASALWYFSNHGCNELADVGDFRKVTKRINGGLNGWEDRLRYWGYAKKAFGVS